MKYFKKMVGSKCFLSPISLDDAERYTEWLNDLEVTQYLSTATHCLPLHAEKEILQSFSKSHSYAIVDLETDTLLGNCGLLDINHLYRTAEVGIFIGNKEYWNKGYGEEALGLLLKYSFNYLNLRNIMLKVFSNNERAIACYKKVGFKEIGKRRNAQVSNMHEHDIVLMDILNDELKSLLTD